MSANSGPSILIVGDNVDDVRQVRSGLAEEFASIEVVLGAEPAIADFDRLLPDVLVLAFDALDKAQQFSLGLLRLSKQAHAHRHQTVLLCGSQDVREVFQLCRKGYFNDYVLYWPHAHDGQRLVMAVWNASLHLAADSQAGSAEAAVTRAETASRIEATVERQLAKGMGHVTAAEASLGVAEQAMGPSPKLVAARQALAASRASLAPMASWAQGLREELGPHVAAVRGAPRGSRGRQPVVLVVEDDAFAAKLIKKALEGEALELEMAADVHAALVVFRRVRPDLVLMDINLPGMDGIAFTKWLKASAPHRDIPIITLTGDARRETIERSRAAGAAGFVVKPFTREALIGKLRPFLEAGATPANTPG